MIVLCPVCGDREGFDDKPCPRCHGDQRLRAAVAKERAEARLRHVHATCAALAGLTEQVDLTPEERERVSRYLREIRELVQARHQVGAPA